MDIQIGDQVTAQPLCWHDGARVKDWPDPQHVCTVKEVKKIHHQIMIRVENNVSGRKEWASPKDFNKVGIITRT